MSDLVALPVGGDGIALASVETRWEVIDNLLLAAFWDAANVTINRPTQSPFDNLHQAVGFGLRYITPFGAIRLDLARRITTNLVRPITAGAPPGVALQEDTSCFGFGGTRSALSDGLCVFHFSVGEAF